MTPLATGLTSHGTRSRTLSDRPTPKGTPERVGEAEADGQLEWYGGEREEHDVADGGGEAPIGEDGLEVAELRPRRPMPDAGRSC